MKRILRINFEDGSHKDLNLVKAVAVDMPNNKQIHLDQMNNGDYRLIYNEQLIPDFGLVKNFEVVRE